MEYVKRTKMKNIKKIKEKIIESLQDLKEFEVFCGEEVFYTKIFKARNKEELEKQFNDGLLDFGEEYIVDCNFIENSLEINEVEKSD